MALTLAVFAMILKIGVPAGFMAGTRAGSSFPIVLCTGQGMVVVEPGESPGTEHGAPGPAKHRTDSPCVFAGHGVSGLILDVPVVVARATIAYPSAPRPADLDAVPGRGLAAPPPPARGPPLST